MRKGWILTLVVFVGLAVIQAAGQEAGQAPPPPQQAQPRGRVAAELQRMTENLNLTEEQRAKIGPILRDEARQLRALRADAALPQGEARAKAREIRQATRRQIAQVLTPEQREKMKAARQGMRGRQSGQEAPPPQNQ